MNSKEYWKNAEVLHYYLDYQAQVGELVDIVRALDPQPETIYEYGCGTGRNLYYIKKNLRSARCFGSDINEKMIAAGSELFPDIRLWSVGLTESYWVDPPPVCLPGVYDLVFTLSVLDHIEGLPRNGMLTTLCGLAKKHLVIIEPYLGYEGEVPEEDRGSPFTYSWDYDKLLNDLPVKILEKRPVTVEGSSKVSKNYFAWICERI